MLAEISPREAKRTWTAPFPRDATFERVLAKCAARQRVKYAGLQIKRTFLRDMCRRFSVAAVISRLTNGGGLPVLALGDVDPPGRSSDARWWNIALALAIPAVSRHAGEVKKLFREDRSVKG